MFNAKRLLALSLMAGAAGTASATVTLDNMLFQPVDPATSVVPAAERTNFTGTVGTLFATDAPQTVQYLGFWDAGGDGFVDDHTITLFFSDDNGANISPIASATITALDSTSAPLVGGYRWVELATPVVLEPQTPRDSDLNGILDWYIISGSVVADGDPFGDLEGEGTNFVLNDSIHGTNANSGDSAFFDARFNDNAGGFGGLSYVGPNLAATIALVPGDADGDGDVDDTDLGLAISNFTGPVGAAGGKTLAEGDTDGDGDVDDTDLGIAISGFTGPLAAPVPEPTSLALLTLGGLLVARRRRG